MREAAIRKLSSRSVAIDLYTGLSCRRHVLRHTVEATWPILHHQFGDAHEKVRFFRHDMLPALPVHPEAEIDIDAQFGLVPHRSEPPAPMMKGAISRRG